MRISRIFLTWLRHFALPWLLVISSQTRALAEEPVVVVCNFQKLPVMILTFRDGMGGDKNTLQIGERPPVPLSVGSSLMTATNGAQEFVFSLRLPASVLITNQGSAGTTVTYGGECVSTLEPR
jgi:hypothetical protein